MGRFGRSNVIVSVGMSIGLLSIACGPDRVVLSTGDAGDAAPTCARDEECARGLVCEANGCVACTKQISERELPCAKPLFPIPVDRNGCTVFRCVPPPPCKDDTQCGPLQRCVSTLCLPCGAIDDGSAAPCPPGWQHYPTNRNGCVVYECARKDECFLDADCGAGGPPMQCYPGPVCDAVCDGTPKCCHGNVCSVPGCTPPGISTPCSFDGCPLGLRCHTTCPPLVCKCNPGMGTWECAPPCDVAACTSDP